MAYNNSPYLQNSTGGSNPPINPFPNNTTMHAVGPDGKPNTVAENNTPVVGVPMMAFNNPPATIATNAYPPPSQPGPGCCPKEFLFATFGTLLAIAGGVMWGVSKSTYTSCLENCIINFLTVSDSCPDDCKSSYDALKTSGIAILIFGGVLLMVAGVYIYNKAQQRQQQLQTQMYQQHQMQMNQLQMLQTHV